MTSDTEVLCPQDLLTLLTMAAEVPECEPVRAARLYRRVVEEQACGVRSWAAAVVPVCSQVWGTPRLWERPVVASGG